MPTPYDINGITLGWFIVPGALGALLGSVVSAAWSHFSGKELRALESRLRKQEETHRLSQSPRVSAATEFWTALCDYERALGTVLSPVQYVKVPSSGPVDTSDWDKLRDESQRADRRNLEARRSTVMVSRDKAEVLLPAGVFAALADLLGAYEVAYRFHWAVHVLPGKLDKASFDELSAKMSAALDDSKALRKEALRTLRGLVETGA